MARTVIGATIWTALLATAACGGSSPSSPSVVTPASPSTTAFSAQVLSARDVTSGTLSREHSDRDDHGRESELEGAIVSIDAAHSSFVVRTTTVTLSDTTVIRHGDVILAFADLAVGQQVHVKGARDGDAVAAREVKVQRDHGRDDDEEHHEDDVDAD